MPTQIEYVTATALGYGNAGAATFLGFVATLPYDGARPNEARQWVEERVTRGGGETTIGAAVFRLSGPQDARTLDIKAVGSRW